MIAQTQFVVTRKTRCPSEGCPQLGAFRRSVAVYGVMHITAHPFVARVVGHSIAYTNGPPHPHLRIGTYGA
jgi:hypothetical protein